MMGFPWRFVVVILKGYLIDERFALPGRLTFWLDPKSNKKIKTVDNMLKS